MTIQIKKNKAWLRFTSSSQKLHRARRIDTKSSQGIIKNTKAHLYLNFTLYIITSELLCM